MRENQIIRCPIYDDTEYIYKNNGLSTTWQHDRLERYIAACSMKNIEPTIKSMVTVSGMTIEQVSLYIEKLKNNM